MSDRYRVYLAGPEVFLPDAIAVGMGKKRLCEERGLEGLFPFDNEIADGADVDLRIYRANVAMMRSADFGIFNLTPFRGPSADVGTVFELGLMTGFGKRCFGYSNVETDLKERMRIAGTAFFDDTSGVWRDAEGLTIEDFGNADNLMIDAALHEGGASLVRRSASHVLRDLSGFSACLDTIVGLLSSRRLAV